MNRWSRFANGRNRTTTNRSLITSHPTRVVATSSLTDSGSFPAQRLPGWMSAPAVDAMRLPLALANKAVIAVEPSGGMRGVLTEQAETHGITNIELHDYRWPEGSDKVSADISLNSHVGYDIRDINGFVDGLEASQPAALRDADDGSSAERRLRSGSGRRSTASSASSYRRCASSSICCSVAARHRRSGSFRATFVHGPRTI